MENFFKVKLDTDPNSLAILRTSETDNKISLGEYMWGEYFLQVFGEFNDQCSWPDGDDLIRKQTRSRSAQVTTSKTAAGEGLATGTVTTSQNFAAPDSDALGYELTKQVESSLLNCISRSVIRDYGSHPFSRVERETQIAARNTGSRSDHSSYRAQRGLSSIVVTNKKNEFRANQRTEYIGVASRYTANTTDNGLEEYPHKLSKLNRTCRRYGLKDSDEKLKIPDDDSHVLLAGVSSLFAFDTLAPLVSLEVGWNLLGHLICDAHVSEPADENAPFLVNKKHTLPIGLFRFIDLLSTSQRTFSYSVQPSGAFSLQRRDRDTSWSLSNIFDGAKRRDQIAAGGDTTESWIEKQYRIIGFGTQRDPVDNEPGSPSEKQRKAKFGWYVFPSSSPGGWYSRPVIQSANIKLSALVSLPAWWQNVNITVTTSWRHPDAPGKPASFGNVNDEASYEENFRVELPTRLEFIRNHFPDSAANRPSLYQLQLPKVTLRACEEANIVLKGERLWRSTVVTLGSQRSSLIQVMPDMRGIIAHFDNVLPLGVSPKNRKADADTGQRSDDAGAAVQSDGDLWIDTVPVTVWTSEGQKSVVDTVSVAVPDTVSKSISEGRPPCKKPDKSDG